MVKEDVVFLEFLTKICLKHVKCLFRVGHNMGDSDDEREFGKRRDKFHTERRGQDRGDDDRRGGFGGLCHFLDSSW